MKALSFCFKRSTAEMLMMRLPGECFAMPTESSFVGGLEIRVLHRHDTFRGVLLLIKTSWEETYKAAVGYRAFWLSYEGNSGQLITGKHTSHHGVYQEEDPDYAAAVQEYERPFSNADFVEESFTALARLVG